MSGDLVSKTRIIRELFILTVTMLAIYHAGRAIFSSAERQLFLHKQALTFQAEHEQAKQINKELREGLSNYRSASGLERLARERLSLAGTDEIIIRVGK